MMPSVSDVYDLLTYIYGSAQLEPEVTLVALVYCERLLTRCVSAPSARPHAHRRHPPRTGGHCSVQRLRAVRCNHQQPQTSESAGGARLA